MNINNMQEFLGFVRSQGLVQLCPEVTAFVICMEELGRLCPCDPEDVRVKKFHQCKAFYHSFANKAKSFSNQLLAKTDDDRIVFSSEGQYMTTITR